MEQYTQLLIGLLETFSPSTKERAASEYLVSQMKALGYDHAYVDESDSAVGIIGDGERTIVLLGHIDTVPGYINVEIKDGKLYGRGSVDAKGPLATFTSAAALVGKIPGWRVVVIGATEEEGATGRGARHQITQWTPELAIIGEPSHWERVTLGYKGRVLLDYELRRALSHTAGRDRNAPEVAVAFWNAACAEAEGFNLGKEKVFDQLLVTLRSIQSSDDGFYETVKMTLGFRLPLDMPPDALKPRMLQHVPPASESGLDVKINFRGDEVAYRAEKNTSLVRMFTNSIRDMKGKPGFVYKTGTSDMNTVAPYWNIPMVAYGPGDSNLDHTPEEHVEIAEYHQAIQVVAGVLRQLDSLR